MTEGHMLPTWNEGYSLGANEMMRNRASTLIALAEPTDEKNKTNEGVYFTNRQCTTGILCYTSQKNVKT